jgi:ABC-2 type transport system ATP-binding protein
LNALDGISFDVQEGELIGLLGPNGAGKTTLVKCLTTLLIPNEGSASVLGHDVVHEPQAVRSLIGWMNGGERTLYWKLSSLDNLRYFGALYGLPGKETDRRIKELLDIMGLWDRRHETLEKFSTGLRQKISIARALLHDPRVLFLDEPTLGLDPTFSRFIRNFLKEKINRDGGKTILLTTHNMHEAEELCDRIFLINNGRIVAQGKPSDLKTQIPFDKNRRPPKIVLDEPSLEDVFIHLTGQPLENDEN